MPGERRFLTPTPVFQLRLCRAPFTIHGVQYFVNPRFEMPRQHTTTPILVVSIVLGVLLFPLVERVIESWMPATAHVTSVDHKDGTSTWDLRTMWN